MRYRQLGKSGIEVSEVGFGTWGIGGTARGSIAYGPTDDAESRRALNRAFELGINFYDTADLYGAGHSDRLLGAAFHDRRDRVVLASKVGYQGTNGRADFAPATIRRVLDESLERLKTDYLDVYQLHDPPIEMLERDPEIFETMWSLRHEGRIRAAGISLRTPDEGRKAIELFRPDCIQVNFNLTDLRALRNGLFRLADETKTGCIIRTPLCFGFLSGEYTASTAFGSGDHRGLWSAEQRATWAKAPTLFREFAARCNCTTAQLALRFCLSYSCVSTVIPGMLTVEHVNANAIAGIQGSLDENERASLEEFAAAQVFFLGKSSGLKPRI